MTEVEKNKESVLSNPKAVEDNAEAGLVQESKPTYSYDYVDQQ